MELVSHRALTQSYVSPTGIYTGEPNFRTKSNQEPGTGLLDPRQGKAFWKQGADPESGEAKESRLAPLGVSGQFRGMRCRPVDIKFCPCVSDTSQLGPVPGVWRWNLEASPW